MRRTRRMTVSGAATGTLLALAVLAASGTAHARTTRYVAEQPAIINGSATTATGYDTRWRAMAAVLTTTPWGSTLCGGAVLDDRTVLTAAHCTYGPSGSTLVPSDVEVVVGRRIANESGGDRIRVSTISRHPSFDRSTMRNDIAVLRLERSPVVAVAHLQPTSLTDQAWWGAGSGLAAGAESVGPWIAGWGATNASGSSFPAELHEARVPIAADDACAGDAAPGHGGRFDRDSMVCAGLPGTSSGTGVDTCQGDSGGPLMVGDGAGSWRLVGLTSWGLDCGGRYFGAYTRVGRYVTWIEPLRWSPSAVVLQPTISPATPPPTSPTPSPPSTTVDASSSPPVGSGPDPAASAVGPIPLPVEPARGAAPPRPSGVGITARGRGWVRLAWRPAPAARQVRAYRLFLRTGVRWRLLRTTPRYAVTIRLRRGRVHALAVQAVDGAGLRSRLTVIARVRTR